MTSRHGQTGAPDAPALRITGVDDHLPAGAEDADATVRGALDRPYTLERWRADLRALGEGTETGFDALDALGLRWLRGKLYAVIARPGHGKTQFLLEAVLRYAEAHPDRLAAFLSWEEPLAELVVRVVLREDARALRTAGSFAGPTISRDWVRRWGAGGNVPNEIRERLDEAAARAAHLLARVRLVDGDAMGRDVADVLRQVAAWTREAGRPLGLVAVDYFQKLRGGAYAPTRQVELQGVADTLRRFAKGSTLAGDVDPPALGYAVPVLVGAQVTRPPAGGGNGDGDEREHPSGDRVREADDLLNDAAALVALSYESQRGGEEHDEARSLRVSLPKHRDGRARPDAVARILWHPARSWLAPGALRDAGGAIPWTPIIALSAARSTANGDKSNNADNGGKAAGGRRARGLIGGAHE